MLSNSEKYGVLADIKPRLILWTISHTWLTHHADDFSSHKSQRLLLSRSFYKKITSRVGLKEHWRNETYQKMPYILASINKENLRILSKKCPLCKSPIRRTPRVHLSRNFPEQQVTPSRTLHPQYQNKTTPHLKKRGRNSVSNASAKFPKIFEYWFRYDLYHLFLVVLFFNLCEKRGYFIFLWFFFYLSKT